MKTIATTELYEPQDVKIKKKLGGGQLKERVLREMPSGKVVEYALAYINHDIYSGDHGRVLGYDNSHRHSHKHLFGEKTDHRFTTYAELYDRFQNEWMAMAIAYANKGK